MGERVNVEGTRAGFDLLDVDRIWKVGDNRPSTLMERLSSFFFE